MKKQVVSIIIPTYNEKENITLLIPVIKEIAKIVKGYTFEIVVVDDDSPDKTGYEAKRKFKPPSVRTFIRKINDGLAGAIKGGIEKSKGEVIIGMDADFNHDPQIIPQILEKLKNYDLVIASRFIKGGGMDDKFRYFSTRIFNFILRFFFGFPITDNASGYYAIRRRDLLKLGLDNMYFGYGEYHLRLVYFAKKAGLRIKEVPVYYKKRPYGQSKSKLLLMAKDYFKEAIRLRFGKLSI